MNQATEITRDEKYFSFEAPDTLYFIEVRVPFEPDSENNEAMDGEIEATRFQHTMLKRFGLRARCHITSERELKERIEEVTGRTDLHEQVMSIFRVPEEDFGPKLEAEIAERDAFLEGWDKKMEKFKNGFREVPFVDQAAVNEAEATFFERHPGTEAAITDWMKNVNSLVVGNAPFNNVLSWN